MRLNLYLAQATGLSRRAADKLIEQGKVSVNGKLAGFGLQVTSGDMVSIEGEVILDTNNDVTIMLNKPVGYICSREGQGNKTVYDLLPPELHRLKPAGRLDKDSSGLLIMTTNGQLAYELTHPKFEKIKKYNVAINKNLTPEDFNKITKTGVMLDDGISKFNLIAVNNDKKEWKVEMKEGRNRQIRRTFDELGYNVVKLHRTHFGPYTLGSISIGEYKAL